MAKRNSNAEATGKISEGMRFKAINGESVAGKGKQDITTIMLKLKESVVVIEFDEVTTCSLATCYLVSVWWPPSLTRSTPPFTHHAPITTPPFTPPRSPFMGQDDAGFEVVKKAKEARASVRGSKKGPSVTSPAGPRAIKGRGTGSVHLHVVAWCG